MKKDYYGILGLKRDANSQDIKKQYYNLALRWHPDKHHDKFEAETKFNEIREAYSVLIDPQEKKFYDIYGERKSQSLFDDDESFVQDPFAQLGKAFRQWDGATIDLLWDIISDEPEEKQKKNNKEHFFSNSQPQGSKMFNQLKRTLSNLLDEHFDDDVGGFFEEFIPDFEEFDFRANFEKTSPQQQVKQNPHQQMKQNQQQPMQNKNGNARSASPSRMFFQPSPSQNFGGNSRESAIIIEDEEPNNAMIIEEDSPNNFFADFSNKLQGFQSSLNDFHQNIEGHFMRSPLMNANFQFYFQNQSA